jgi:hypothetical protein
MVDLEIVEFEQDVHQGAGRLAVLGLGWGECPQAQTRQNEFK